MFNLAVSCNYKVKQLITSINIIYYQHYQLLVPRIALDTSWVALNRSPMNEIITIQMIVGMQIYLNV